MRKLLKIAFVFAITIAAIGAGLLHGWWMALLVLDGVMGGWWLRELQTWRNDEGKEGD